MTNTLKLTDGITTIDLLGDTDHVLLEGGLALPPPTLDLRRVRSPFAHGEELQWSRYANRQLTVNLRMGESSLANLQSEIRSLERMCHEATVRAALPWKYKLATLLTNGSIETGGTPPTGWTESNATMTRVSTPTALDGLYAGKVLANCAGAQSYVYQAVATYYLYRSKVIYFGGWYYAPATNDKDQVIELTDGVTPVTYTLTADDAWHWQAGSITLDAAATELTLKLHAAYTSTSDTDDYLIVDGMVLSTRQVLPTNTPLMNNRWHLLHQWGSDETEHTYYEVVSAAMAMPGSLWTVPTFGAKTIWPVSLSLEVKPFGIERFRDYQSTISNGAHTRAVADYYNFTAAGTLTVDDTNWEGQTFRATSSYDCYGIAMKGIRIGTLTTATLYLYSTHDHDAIGTHPNAVLASATVDVSTVSTGAGTWTHWVRAFFAAPVALVNGTDYAIVIRANGVTAPANRLYMVTDPAAGYGGTGSRVYTADSGANWTVDATDDESFAAIGLPSGGAVTGYHELTTEVTASDVPPKTRIKLSPSGTTGTKKTWVAKRSGARYDEVLQCEGEDETAWTLVDGTGTITHFDLMSATSTQGFEKMVYIAPPGGNIAASTVVGYMSYQLASPPPRGQYRILARIKVDDSGAADYDHLQTGFGWAYGVKTKTPSAASDEYHAVAANDTYEILDLGVLTIPPVPESEVQGDSVFTLRLYLYANEVLTNPQGFDWYCDFILLFPLDEGACIIDDTAATSIICLDAFSYPSGVYYVDSSDLITTRPDYVGQPFTVGAETTRIYALRDDTPVGVSWTSDIKLARQRLAM